MLFQDKLNVDPGTCLTQQNQDVPLTLALNVSCSLHTAKELEARPKAQIAVSQSKAKQFLSALHRTKRNVWDRSRPDVQQWIQQFMNMGYDEAVSKTVITQMMSNSLCQLLSYAVIISKFQMKLSPNKVIMRTG